MRWLLLLLSTSILSTGVLAQQVGSCEVGKASRDLDVNNVRARIYNTGAFFWKGSGNVYTVPKKGGANAIFVSTIQMGGLVGDEIRFSGSTYGPFAFWPGPLNDRGEPPADCSEYDQVTFEAGDLPPGAYFYELEVGLVRGAHKMVLTR